MTGLRGRLVLALVATSLATLGVATLVVVPLLEHRLESDRVASLRSLARAIRPALRAIPDRDREPGAPAVARVADRLQRRAGGRIVIYGHGGAELADTATEPARGTPAVARLDRERALAVRRRDGVVSWEHAGVAFGLTVAGEGSDRLTLVIAKSLGDTRAAAQVVRGALPGALVAGLAVALLLALLASRGLLRRLSLLKDDAQALGAEGLEHRVSVRGTDEVAVVARALEQMRGRLAEEEASRQAFIATASHELRTPLASLQATLELLGEEIRTGAADERTVAARGAAALRQTHRLVALATDLLELSRIEGGAPLRLEPLELGELARTVAHEFSAPLRADGRPLRVAGGPVLALADPAAAARIVRILLDNAVKYGDGAVEVGVAAGPAGRAVLSVQDQGQGVAPDERVRVFGRFERGRAARGAPGGAGLGLAIARTLAREMRGSLEVVATPAWNRFELDLRGADAGEADGARNTEPGQHPAPTAR